jgi:polysaccharide biosynthesis transport protein
MDKSNFDINRLMMGNSKSIKDYVLLIRNNLMLVVVISLAIASLSVLYALFSKNIYKSTVALKISQPQQNILQSTQVYERIEYADRLIANEIGIIQNYDTREKTALALIDSFKNTDNKELFFLLKSKKDEGIDGHKPVGAIAGLLKGVLKVEQSSGTDVLEISAESPSPYEAALIANTTAYVYRILNLGINRGHLTTIRTFFEKQSQEKLSELGNTEDSLINFRQKGGIVALDAQSASLISQLSQLDAQRDATSIELETSNELLKQYKSFLSRQDPQLVLYLENRTSQAYIDGLQRQIAELQVNRDLALSVKSSTMDVSAKARDFDKRIDELKAKLSTVINEIKTESYAAYPEQIRQLAQNLVEEEIKNNTLKVQLNQLNIIIRRYEQDLNRLPKASIELAQYERKRESIQQLYTLIDQRYQEAMMSELSQPGNAFVIGEARIPDGPVKPNRIMIILFGFILGPILAFGYLLIKDYFDDRVKSPEDIDKNNIKYLTWLPDFNTNGEKDPVKHELIVLNKPDSPASESFRSIRARVQFSIVDSEPPRVILITSPAEQEGKTVVSVNLASSYALADNKTLLLECDLRKPRIHSVMDVEKRPGLVDYLANKVGLEDIIRKTKNDNLFYITSGSIPPNPAEILESKLFRKFLQEIRSKFDIIIIDSPPIVAVIDAETLARLVDGTILVVSSDKTETAVMNDAVALINKDKVPFLGTVLNNFRYKSGYNYYYKYYYGYSTSNGKGKKKNKISKTN